MSLPSFRTLLTVAIVLVVSSFAIPGFASLTPASGEPTALPQIVAAGPSEPIDVSPDLGMRQSSPALAYTILPDQDFALDLTGLADDNRDRRSIVLSRALPWGAVNLAGMAAAFETSQSSWGRSSGRFHFKHDFKGDGMALSDETSHMFAAYRLSQVLQAGYQWTGLDDGRSRRAALVQSWLLMFAVEYPIDAYNPTQGFGVSDLLFNTAGVLMAYHRAGADGPRWDLKMSVKRQFFEGESRVIARSDEQYDDYIYWLTWRPVQNRYTPLLLAVGYSTTHEPERRIAKELHIGIGTSLQEIGGLFGPTAERYLTPLNFLLFHVGGKIVWR